MWVRGTATSTLDTGQCPPWLFRRIVEFCRLFVLVSSEEIGVRRTLLRFADPVWFQSFGCLAGFDWNASGLTTVVLGALKEALKPIAHDIGWTICGGKGRIARHTPAELRATGERWHIDPSTWIEVSRLTAKIDNHLIQDGFTIYHHTMLVARDGYWLVIQQGMNTTLRQARRYHWAYLPDKSQFLQDPHQGIMGSAPSLRTVLNLAAKASRQNRQITLEWLHNPKQAMKDLAILERCARRHPPSRLLPTAATHVARIQPLPGYQEVHLSLGKQDFFTHPVMRESLWTSPYLRRLLAKLFQEPPSSYLELVMRTGVGAQTLRALALVAELLYGAKPSYEDPQRYTFAHGGKDGVPYPVNRRTYDETLSILRKVLVRLKERDVRRWLDHRIRLWETRIADFRA